MKGLYIHVPFCERKCGYCDFYSVIYDEALVKDYVTRLKEELNALCEPFETLYFGGGTPSLLKEHIADIIPLITLTENAEVTLECNPASDLNSTLLQAAKAGVNRVSFGLQSAVEGELAFLTRRHSADDVKAAVKAAKDAGIQNISLDIILGLEGQTIASLKETLDFCISLEVTHISGYLLKIEEKTPFFEKRHSFHLPDENKICELYIFCCEYLEQAGFLQYEISNFAKKGFESRHNLKYWNCNEYIGIGPAAHSFYENKRYYYSRDIVSFLSGASRKFDCAGGDFHEYLMLRLRLVEGLSFEAAKDRGYEISADLLKRATFLSNQGYIEIDENHFHLTRNGFLVQNQILNYLMQ